MTVNVQRSHALPALPHEMLTRSPGFRLHSRLRPPHMPLLTAVRPKLAALQPVPDPTHALRLLDPAARSMDQIEQQRQRCSVHHPWFFETTGSKLIQL